MTNRTATALATLIAGMLVLTGCSDAGGKVSGNRDDVKHKSAVAEVSHTKQVKKTKKTRTCSGTGKKKRCSTSSRSNGYKSVKVVDKPGKPALYCVELDNVNGKPTRDDRWYEVTSSVYYKMASKNEGAKVTKMKYLTTGCSR